MQITVQAKRLASTRPASARLPRISAIYGIVMGTALLATWVVLFWNGIPPEFRATPLESWFLLLAEVLTGTALVLGGYGVLTTRDWGRPLHLVSLGMMLYTCVYSIGVFSQSRNVPAAMWFVLTSVMTLLLVIAHAATATPSAGGQGPANSAGRRS